MTLYAHLDRFNVKVGQFVQKELIGWTGNTGLSTGLTCITKSDLLEERSIQSILWNGALMISISYSMSKNV